MMMKHLRRTLTATICVALLSVSSVALAAPSKIFTQKPTLRVSTPKSGPRSGEYEDYSVTPSLPGFLTDYTVNRRYQGSLYHIHVTKTGNPSISVDGTALTGNVLPKGEKEYHVEVTL